MGDFQTHEHDVLVIGAGGAGLRAAIEAAAVDGCSVGIVCKSLLGKAHTVMAEGGVAAAMANVDERDGWQTHFADTMRGGQYLNNPTMAELHAKEAPARVHELEEWGALFDRTKDGRILQRNFGGHAYPRLAHVGDRTGLEMIRTLQDHGIHQGIEVYMECTVIEGETSDTVEFARSGCKGRLIVAADHFDLDAKLGFLLGAFSKTIEGEIEKNLDSLLAASAKKAPAKKAAPKKK